jgi:hypothetical protein
VDRMDGGQARKRKMIKTVYTVSKRAFNEKRT